LAPDANVFLAFLAMGSIYSGMTLVWFIFYVYLLNSIRNFMQRPTTAAVIEAMTGVVLIGFGIKLAFEQR
ncbi:MAG: LysE family transporter, partial [Caryophanon sp.]|nr:LysE family transporter [Caryophanon sp.]